MEKRAKKRFTRLRKLAHRILLEFSPFGFTRNFIVFPITSFFRSKKILFFKKYEIIEKYKDKYKGKRCFIIATGPSLTLEDVLLLKYEYTIGMNTIFKMYDKTDWRPTFYALLDPNLYKKLLQADQLMNVHEYGKEACFFNSVSEKEVDTSTPKNILINYCWLDHVYNYSKSDVFRFSDDMLKGMYDFYSSTQSLITLAMYMGFSEIYLLGADNNYLGKNQHFANTNGEVILEESQAYKSQTANDKGYQAIAEIADRKGVYIYNATRGGRVEVFPRVTLENVIKRKILNNEKI